MVCLWLQDIVTAVRGSDLVDSWLLLGEKLWGNKQAGTVLPAMQRGWIQVTFKHSTRIMPCQHSWGCLGSEVNYQLHCWALGKCCSPLNWQSAHLKLASVESFCTAGLQQRHAQICVVTRGWGRDRNPPWQLQWDWGYSLAPHRGKNIYWWDFFSLILYYFRVTFSFVYEPCRSNFWPRASTRCIIPGPDHSPAPPNREAVSLDLPESFVIRY